MRHLTRGAVVALGLMVGACGAGGEEAATDNAAAVAQNDAIAVAAADAARDTSPDPALPSCPFRETQGWQASVTNGELLVNGQVDMMMAGFTPTLTRREGTAGAFLLDLALVPDATAAVNDLVRYEESGVPRHPRLEIYCGGELIETVDVVLVG